MASLTDDNAADGKTEGTESAVTGRIKYQAYQTKELSRNKSLHLACLSPQMPRWSHLRFGPR